ncbi:outer membrane protein [Phaeovulum sp.]|uniref:outer membrane protein n=1 Tax=Phaeovulum sp. TaxID=2934796 RepID=UPI003565FEF7
MFKTTLLSSAALLVAMSSTAFAGGYVAPVVAQPVMEPVVQVHDWSGAYAGLKIGQSSGDWDWDTSTTGSIDSGNAYGGFAGYNVQRGNLVYGVEVGLNQSNVEITTPVAFDAGNFMEIKGRVGYAMDRVMFYGALGYMSGDINDGTDDVDLDGMTYGIGAEFMLTDNIFAGLEYQRAALSGTYGGADLDADVDTVALRVGFQF